MNCTGRCCAVFALPRNAPKLLRDGANGDDGAFILDMIVPLTPTRARSRLRRLGYDDNLAPIDGKRFFTCRHWDEDTRRCGVYDKRPKMCSGYPYGVPCEHDCGCTDDYPE